MTVVSMHHAKRHLSKLIERVALGESFVITKAGEPIVRVVPMKTRAPQRLGFLSGEISVPEDYDRMTAG